MRARGWPESETITGLSTPSAAINPGVGRGDVDEKSEGALDSDPVGQLCFKLQVLGGRPVDQPGCTRAEVAMCFT